MQFDLRWPYFAILREMRRKISIIDVGLAGKKNFSSSFVCSWGKQQIKRPEYRHWAESGAKRQLFDKFQLGLTDWRNTPLLTLISVVI
jgi:hypothetical protein